MNFVKVTWDDDNLIFETEDGRKKTVYGNFKLVYRGNNKDTSISSYMIENINPHNEKEGLGRLALSSYHGTNLISYSSDPPFFSGLYKIAQQQSRKLKLEALGI